MENKICVVGVRKFYQFHPTLVAVITTRVGDKDNAMAAAWHSPLSFNPPLYGVSISPKRLTHNMMIEAEEFGVNFLPKEKAELVSAVGGCSGKDVDKFKAFGIEKDKPIKTNVPILEEAYAAYECKLITHHTYGDHEWFVGEILATHMDKKAFLESGLINLNYKVPPLYLGRDMYMIPKKWEILHLDREICRKKLDIFK